MNNIKRRSCCNHACCWFGPALTLASWHCHISNWRMYTQRISYICNINTVNVVHVVFLCARCTRCGERICRLTALALQAGWIWEWATVICKSVCVCIYSNRFEWWHFQTHTIRCYLLTTASRVNSDHSRAIVCRSSSVHSSWAPRKSKTVCGLRWTGSAVWWLAEQAAPTHPYQPLAPPPLPPSTLSIHPLFLLFPSTALALNSSRK